MSEIITDEIQAISKASPLSLKQEASSFAQAWQSENQAAQVSLSSSRAKELQELTKLASAKSLSLQEKLSQKGAQGAPAFDPNATNYTRPNPRARLKESALEPTASFKEAPKTSPEQNTASLNLLPSKMELVQGQALASLDLKHGTYQVKRSHKTMESVSAASHLTSQPANLTATSPRQARRSYSVMARQGLFSTKVTPPSIGISLHI